MKLPSSSRFTPGGGQYLEFRSGATVPVVAKDLGGPPCSVLQGELLPGSH